MEPLKIREARKKAKITQEELALALGVNRATISKYEAGLITPPLKQMAKIAEILNVPFVDLIPLDLTEDQKRFFQYMGDNADKFADAEDERRLKRRERILEAFEQLNTNGQEKAIERVEELTEIPKYQKQPALQEE